MYTVVGVIQNKNLTHKIIQGSLESQKRHKAENRGD